MLSDLINVCFHTLVKKGMSLFKRETVIFKRNNQNPVMMNPLVQISGWSNRQRHTITVCNSNIYFGVVFVFIASNRSNNVFYTVESSYCWSDCRFSHQTLLVSFHKSFLLFCITVKTNTHRDSALTEYLMLNSIFRRNASFYFRGDNLQLHHLP